MLVDGTASSALATGCSSAESLHPSELATDLLGARAGVLADVREDLVSVGFHDAWNRDQGIPVAHYLLAAGAIRTRSVKDLIELVAEASRYRHGPAEDATRPRK